MFTLCFQKELDKFISLKSQYLYFDGRKDVILLFLQKLVS
jgi:hypothetical protein